MKKQHIISWIAQVIIVVIIGQSLFFKFTDAPETVGLFEQLGMGIVGYKLIGFLELVACVLLLIRNSIIWGAILSWGLMSGAIVAHVTEIGFSENDGFLGGAAILVWFLSMLVIYLRKEQVSFIGNMFGDKNNGDLA